jgi:hypothetical protein
MFAIPEGIWKTGTSFLRGIPRQTEFELIISRRINSTSESPNGTKVIKLTKWYPIERRVRSFRRLGLHYIVSRLFWLDINLKRLRWYRRKPGQAADQMG